MSPIARLPPAVLPGDRVGVAALSSPVDPGRLAAGLAELVRLGFEPVLAPNLERRERLFAGGDEERTTGLHELADDPTIKAIFFARGGHGVLRILDRLDWNRLSAIPRAFVGYSDLTPVLDAVVERCGWVAFHGPMVGADMALGLDVSEERSLFDALSGAAFGPFELESVDAGEPIEGVLRGGCLSLFAATCGTAHAPDLRGSILFLEDIDEPLYRLDRMLTQLRLSGSLNDVRAMIFGNSIAPGNLGPLLDLARDAAPSARLAGGLAAGHHRPNLTLPLGLRCRLDPGAPGDPGGGRLTMLAG